MNQNYYPNGNGNSIPYSGTMPPVTNMMPGFANQQNNQGKVEYADNIFQMNIGKNVSVYMSYPDSVEWRDRVFTGTIRSAGRDYLLLESNGIWTLLWMIYINYAIFEETVSY